MKAAREPSKRSKRGSCIAASPAYLGLSRAVTMEMGCVRLILQEAGGPDLIFFVEIQRVEQVFIFMVHCTNSCCNAANPVIYNLRAGARRASAQGSGQKKQGDRYEPADRF